MKEKKFKNELNYVCQEKNDIKFIANENLTERNFKI